MTAIILEVKLKNIAYNYNQFKRLNKDGVTAAVVKANAYGLGIKKIFYTLRKNGCSEFFTATIEEAIELRKLNKTISIYVLNGIQKYEIKEFLKNKIIPVINTVDEIKIISKYSNRLSILIHFDTGMNRLGLKYSQIKKIAKIVDKNDIKVKYIISHLASAERIRDKFNNIQYNKFIMARKIYDNMPLSLCNSAGTFLPSKFRLNMIRPGISLYGGYGNNIIKKLIKNPIKLKAKIIQIKNINKDETIGYNQTYKTKRNQFIATIAAGYGDGIKIQLSNKGVVIYKNKRMPIVGRISMDTLTVDITKYHKIVKLGDYVELINDQNDIEIIAKQSGTVSQDILTSFGKRIKVIYK
tara:strand:+ start:20480 stop:21541 length:1062 start_codon:yes stop_codon:yes gene_type:complete